NIGWRLDYVLASAPLAASATSCEVYREFGTSDHGPVQAIFDLPPSQVLPPEEPELEPDPPEPVPQPANPEPPPSRGQLPLKL
ncbi:MAG: hypothetical protein ACJ79Y_00230, partial [Myxococcales bacterium]